MSEYKDYKWGVGATHAHSYLYNDLKTLIGNNKSQKILDIGCGNGEMENRILSEGYVYAV